MSFTLIIGPMKSGKSLELIARLSPYEFTEKKILFVQPTSNVRDEAIVSRSGISKAAVKVHDLSEVHSDSFDVIGVDEINMFPEESWVAVQRWLNEGKDVVISGLDLDYSATLIPIVRHLLELKPELIIDRLAVCELCRQYTARFTQIVHEGKVVRGGLPHIVPEDGTFSYRPVCRTCYQLN